MIRDMIGTKLRTVIVTPTYNEKENIGILLNKIIEVNQRSLNSEILVLVVDDSSPDGTGKIVEEYSKRYNNIFLYTQKTKGGLGKAYIEGFKYAINKLNADCVVEMDADLSHNPDDLHRLSYAIQTGGDFVIGSRYVPGGSIPEEWPFIRKLNSKIGNWVARNIAGLKGIKDCTSGYRAIKASIIKNIDLNKLGVKGYSFQMNLLHAAYKNKARIIEVPITFIDRIHGYSKLRFSDIKEFVLNAFYLRFPGLKKVWHFFLLTSLLFLLAAISRVVITGDTTETLTKFIIGFSIVLIFQSLFNLFTMLFAWENIEEIEKNKPPEEFITPQLSFSILLPARHEENVIGDTILSLSKIKYPKTYYEILVVCREDDIKTIKKVEQAIAMTPETRIKLIIFNDYPINKPHSLNIGLMHATGDVVCILDAEDSLHPDLINVINSVMVKEKVDVIQSGVQLMNWYSSWFSALNVLEYYFWFKSSLHFFSKFHALPLGGNTVFFKKEYLNTIGGWDENCLTEDADIGLKMSILGAKIRVLYDSKYTTKEETPTDTLSFIKQRTRWNQGFFQIFGKYDWLKLKTLKQKLLFLYILLLPMFQSMLLLLLPLCFILAFALDMPVVWALLSFIPLTLLVLQLVVYNIGFYEFLREYKIKYAPITALKLTLFFFPYQVLLSFSAFRALFRVIFGVNNWEKTLHINAHRKINNSESLNNLKKVSFASYEL